MGRTVTVDGDDAASGGSFLYPDGEYIGEIIDVQSAKDGYAKSGANKGKPAINVKFRWEEAQKDGHVGKKFVAWQVPDFPKFASGSAAFLYFQFYKALGVVFPKEGESGEVELPDFDDILGQTIGVRLSVEEGDVSKGYKDRNKVSAFFPPDKGITVTTEASEEFDLDG
jgi:hypothetical protein